ncbi:hypothetical protein [Bradyrhizobium sp. Leo121]|uniref:hypothetical protein n=1 Tax=Bradyrhizobium sp. Leo121 TaxID=1571195 RepID=UPI0010291156|nr:hypothetical protein [Bradyrhizobium sp. Leo121]
MIGNAINPDWYEKLKLIAGAVGGGAASSAGLIPQNSQTGDYTCVLSDAGKHIYLASGSHTFTIPANSSVAYEIGTTITFVNTALAGNVLTIACGDTMILMNGAASPSFGNRTLANFGLATALKVGTVAWVISGVGLT